MILTGKNWDAQKSMEAGLINRVVPHDQLQDEAWKWAEEIGKFDKVTLKYCKMAAHASMEAATVPAAAEVAWLMQEEHALVNPRAYAGTRGVQKKKEHKKKWQKQKNKPWTPDLVSGAVLVLFALLVILETRHYPLGTFRLP